MIRTISLTTILAAAIALPAIAQTAPAAVPPVIAAPSAVGLVLTAEQGTAWVGKPVYSSDDKKIGEVVAFARAGNDTVTEMYAGIGGFLGMGETNVRLLPSQIRMLEDRIVLTVTAAQAKDLPKVIK